MHDRKEWLMKSRHVFAFGFLASAVLAGTSIVPGASAPSDEAAVVRAVPESSPDLVAHEWGTFTSVAGPDGRAVEWTPLSGPSDLPCFVTVLNPTSLKIGPKGFLPSVKATVRMETPVIYFYSDREQTVDVRVRFPQGLITEWYPQAVVPAVPPLPIAKMSGGITWKDVRISPLPGAVFPREADKSHYYAARETDAAPVQVGAQSEKFLFYRGLASFPVAVSARVIENGSIAVENPAGDIGFFVLFEKRGGRLGYRVIRNGGQTIAVARPALTGTFEALRRELQAALTEQGLFGREASAMIETWRDSWFEDGTRLFYVMSQQAVDAILPLDIEPLPARTVRVFVGRIEIVTPEIMTEVEQAIRARDTAALARHGRFLEPIADRIRGRFTSAAEQAAMKSALDGVAAKAAPAASRP
jgi:hypothetical protein